MSHLFVVKFTFVKSLYFLEKNMFGSTVNSQICHSACNLKLEKSLNCDSCLIYHLNNNGNLSVACCVV